MMMSEFLNFVEIFGKCPLCKKDVKPQKLYYFSLTEPFKSIIKSMLKINKK